MILEGGKCCIFTWNILSYCLSTSETSMAWLTVSLEFEWWWLTRTRLVFCYLVMQMHCKQPSFFPTLLNGFWCNSILFVFVPVFGLCRRFDFQKFPSSYFQISTVTHRSVSVSRASTSDAAIKAGVNLKKKRKTKKRDHIEKNPFIATLQSIKKEMGIHDITPEKFWSMQRNVSKFYNHRTMLHFIHIFQLF